MHPEDIINKASRMACRLHGPILLRNGTQYLRMGLPAARNYGFGGYLDLDVNRVRVLTMVYDMRKNEMVLKDNDKQPPEILATVKVPRLCIEDSPEPIAYVKSVKEPILNFVRFSEKLVCI